jgi:scyllo-inositol 2-dehydrogenase (NADP+)
MGPMAVNVGIIGFGRIGAEHSDWLAKADGIRAVAVADETPARRAIAVSRGLKAYATIEELLADSTVNAVLVATPTAMHFDHATAALAAGKHVMIEKPVTLDLETAEKLASDAKGRQLVVSVFHNRRWDKDYLTIRQAVQSGRFGKVFNVESRLGQWSSCVGPAAKEYRPGWRNEAGFGGGGLYDWGSHFIDQMWRLLFPAKPVRVFAQLHGNVWTTDCDDFARICIDFDNGAAGLVEINTTTTRPLPRWHIDGETGSADSPFSLAFDIETWASVNFTPADGSRIQSVPKVESGGLSERQIWEQFGRAVIGVGTPAVPIDSVLPTMALLDAARESARTGSVIQVDSATSWSY